VKRLYTADCGNFVFWVDKRLFYHCAERTIIEQVIPDHDGLAGATNKHEVVPIQSTGSPKNFFTACSISTTVNKAQLFLIILKHGLLIFCGL
jgi:hypothetical protein